IFLMEADPKPRLEISPDHHRSLRVQHGAARQPAFDRVEDHIRIEPGARRQHQRFAHRPDIARPNHLVRGLGDVAWSDGACERDAGAHGLKDWQHLLEYALIAAHHDGEGTVDGLRLSTADRRIEKPDALGRTRGANLLRNQRADGTHVGYY